MKERGEGGIPELRGEGGDELGVEEERLGHVDVAGAEDAAGDVGERTTCRGRCGG